MMALMAHSLAVFLVAQMLPGVRIRSLLTAVAVALVYGVLKFLLWWVLVLFSLPLVFITLGLFLVVINAFLLWLTDKLIDGFEIRGFGTTIIASVLISILDVILRFVLPGV